MDDCYDANVVTVDVNSKVTVVAAGSTTVKATGASSHNVGSCAVTVRAASAVSVTPKTLELQAGKTGKVTATYDEKKTIKWTTNDSAVATVADGTVTAIKAGIAVITVTGGTSKYSAGFAALALLALVPMAFTRKKK